MIYKRYDIKDMIKEYDKSKELSMYKENIKYYLLLSSIF